MFESLTSRRCKSNGSTAYATLQDFRPWQPKFEAGGDIHTDWQIFRQFELDELFQILSYTCRGFFKFEFTLTHLDLEDPSWREARSRNENFVVVTRYHRGTKSLSIKIWSRWCFSQNLLVIHVQEICVEYQRFVPVSQACRCGENDRCLFKPTSQVQFTSLCPLQRHLSYPLCWYARVRAIT